MWPSAKSISLLLAPTRLSQPRLRASYTLKDLLFMCLSPKKGWDNARLQQTILTSHPVLAGYFCWNKLHLLLLYNASHPDILLCSYCQHCNEKWLFYYVCFHLNPSRKDLVFSSSLLLKLALASCRTSGLDSCIQQWEELPRLQRQDVFESQVSKSTRLVITP